MGHFVSSPREREKRDKRDNRGVTEEMKEGDMGKRRKMIEIEGTEEIKTFPLYTYLLQR